jgi:hypothetical protein
MAAALVNTQTHNTTAVSILVACELWIDLERNMHRLNVRATLNRYRVTVRSQHFLITGTWKDEVNIQVFIRKPASRIWDSHSRGYEQSAWHLLVSWSTYSSTLKMEVTCSSETSVDFQRTTPRYIPEDVTIHNHRCENQNSIVFLEFHTVFRHLIIY